MDKIAGVILAGGQARRMGGGDKGLLPLGSVRVLDLVLDRLSPQVDRIAINANGDAARFADFGYPVIADSEPDFPGPLAGVLAGMDWAAQHGASHIVTVAADTPFFPRDLVLRLARAGNGIVLAATEHPQKGVMRHPTFGQWPVALRQNLRRALRSGVRKIVAWTDGHNGTLAEFGTDPFDPFFNINTPQDLETAQDLLAEGVA